MTHDLVTSSHMYSWQHHVICSGVRDMYHMYMYMYTVHVHTQAAGLSKLLQ